MWPSSLHIRLSAGLAAGTVLWAGCDRARGTDPADTSTATVLIQADERLFGPYWSIDAWFLMFLPLVSIDADGEIAPRLAASWEHSDDYRTWTFYLQPDARWHDGVPVTAHDVKFTIELAAHPEILFDDPWHDVDSIAVHDDTTLTIFYRRPKDARNTWMVYWPRHLLEGLDPGEFWEWDFWTEPVGNGPYRYVRHVPKTMVEVEANPDFYAGEPAIDRLIIQFGGATGITELLSGNVDVLTWVNQADLPKLAADPRFRVHHFMWPGVAWLEAIVWNHANAALSDPRVRRAVTHAIDRRELLHLLNLPEDLRLVDVPFTGRQYRSAETPPALAYDPELAGRLLDEAGWRDRDGDGLRERGSEALRFVTLLQPGGAQEQTAVYLQHALRKVGVGIEIQTVERSILHDRIRTGGYDAAIVPLWNHVDGHLRSYGASAVTPGTPPEVTTPYGYVNAGVTRLLVDARDTADPERIDSIYRELWPTLLTDLPITLLYPQVQTYVVHRRIRGLEGPHRSEPVMFMEHLWIEEPPQ